MSAQQVEQQVEQQVGHDDEAAGPVTGTGTSQMAPVLIPEPVAAVEVRRNAAVGAGIGVAAAAVGIAYLWRAAGTGSPLDWALCALMAVLALVFLRSLFDARTPLLVIDELGVRMRLANHWRGLPWEAVDTVTVQPRRGLLRDGRVVVSLHHEQRALEGLDGRARRQARLNRKRYGAALAVPLGLTTRVAGSDAGELTDRVAALSEGRAEVVTLVPTRSTPARPAPVLPAEPPLVTTPADHNDVEEYVEGYVEPLAEPLAEPPAGTEQDERGTQRRVRWLRLPGRSTSDQGADQEEDPAPVASDPGTDRPTDGATDGATDWPTDWQTNWPTDWAETDAAGSHLAQDASSSDHPVALRRIGEVTTAMTSAVTGVVTEVVAKAVAPVQERDAADSKVRAIAKLGDPVAPLVIDTFRPEPAYDPVIGPELAAARTRVGLSVDELADRTRIRPHVIESIEVDDFAACGGDFYARGHIRTLARVLGKDPVPLLETFESRYASAPVNARTVFEAELSTGMVGSTRRTTGGPNWALLVGAVLALVMVWSLVRLFAGTGNEVLEDPPPMLNGSAGIGVGAQDQVEQREQQAPAAQPVATTLTAVDGGTRVVVRDGDGTVVHRGVLLAGEVQQLEVEPPVTVEAGDGSVVSVSLDGRDLGLVGDAAQSTVRTYQRPSR